MTNIEALRDYYDNTDIADVMAKGQRVDLGDFTAPDTNVSFTVSMPNRVLRAAREVAEQEGTTTNDVLRSLIESGLNQRHSSGGEAAVPISELMRLIDEARGA